MKIYITRLELWAGIFILVGFATFFVVENCREDGTNRHEEPPPIVGKWGIQYGPSFYDFRPNGYVCMLTSSNGDACMYRYCVCADTLTIYGEGKEFVYIISFTGNDIMKMVAPVEWASEELYRK